LILLLALVTSAAACGSDSNPSSPTSSGPYSQTDLVIGTGALVNTGSRATVAYAGWLYDTSRTDGKGTQFDSNQVGFTFTVGTGTVIAGWDRGVVGMRVGGLRRLIIPPDLAYGSAGRSSIPPNATLVFDITLLSVQ
jgi:FKBP-type peptidyl-prolyl cis-trans isomerase FkpA